MDFESKKKMKGKVVMNFESKRKMKGKIVAVDGENEAGSSNASTNLFVLEEFASEKLSKRDFE